MVDYVAKMMILRPTYSMATVVDTTKLVVDVVVWAHGLPKVIVFNRDTRFTSHFRREVHRVMGTTLAMFAIAKTERSIARRTMHRIVIRELHHTKSLIPIILTLTYIVPERVFD